MMDKKFFLSLAASFLIAALCACGSSPPPDEIIPLYQGFPGQEFPFEETAETDTGIPNLPDDLPQEPSAQEPLEEEPAIEEPIAEEQITEEQITEEPPIQEPLPEAAEDEEPSPEIPVEEDQETLESLRETVEALRETVEALREALEALRTPSPETPPSLPPAPVETPPPAVEPPPLAPEPLPEPPPPVPVPQPPAPVEEPLPPEQPTPEPPAPEPEPPPPEPEPPPPAPEPPPPAPPPEPPSYLGPAEPFNPPPVTEPFTPAPPPELPDRAIPETPGEDIVFSRIVRVTVGQILEIPFRGTGWVYLGELGNRRGINYESRRLDLQGGGRIGEEVVEGQSFIFSVDRAGTYILRFYRQDFIQDYIINDNVQVIAGERDENTGRVTGDRVIAEPRWPPVVDTVERPATPTPVVPPVVTPEPATPTQAIPPVTVTDTVPEYVPPAAAPVTPQAPPPVESPSDYVRRARAEFDAGRIESALGILDSFSQNYPGGTDDAWWLYGQLLEANSPSRDIRMAIDYYRRLVNDFPFSDLVEDARRRIAYLERFYFNIR